MSRGALQKLHSRSSYEKRTKVVFYTSSKKGLENRSSRFEPKISLISFSRGSNPPLKYGKSLFFLGANDMLWRGQACGEHPINHIGPKKLSGTVANLRRGSTQLNTLHKMNTYLLHVLYSDYLTFEKYFRQVGQLDLKGQTRF